MPGSGSSKAAAMAKAGPLAVCYMRVAPGEGNRMIRHTEGELRNYASAVGLRIARLYHEETAGSFAVWLSLIRDLDTTGIDHVLLPSLSHLALHERLRQGFLEQLQETTGADVYTLVDGRLQVSA